MNPGVSLFSHVFLPGSKTETLGSKESPLRCTSSGSDSEFTSTEENICAKKKVPRKLPGNFKVEELFSKIDNSVKEEDFHLRRVKVLRIKDGSVGYGYDRLFSEGLNEQLKTVYVEDPYVSTESQVCNFVVFCEVLVSKALNLKRIVLRTRSLRPDSQYSPFTDLKTSLLARQIQLEVQRSDTIHDREIRFDNGWTYRIGRGLDYFQKQSGVTLGHSNYNFRRCLETCVCITKDLD
ncbi:unnamed protein product [Enterobius vermicularis]|uniref:MIT_C domain-containing protein n=1 Tax=Enterobius vermicularis TaxID=51028 RepID=A0A0N4VGR2_ENTVE|nr:unnamed protein product [Enterobius vermicularis]